MPRVQIVFYLEKPGEVPVLDWIEVTERQHRGSSNKFRAYIELLQEKGHELRRPITDYLRDDIYELRPTYENQAYRILYFFDEQKLDGNRSRSCVLCNALLKIGDHQGEFEKAIDKSIKRRLKYLNDRAKHTYEE